MPALLASSAVPAPTGLTSSRRHGREVGGGALHIICCGLVQPLGGGGGGLRSSDAPRPRLNFFAARRRVIPPSQTKVTIVGKNEIYDWENLVGPFLVHKLLGSRPPLRPPSPPVTHSPGCSPSAGRRISETGEDGVSHADATPSCPTCVFCIRRWGQRRSRVGGGGRVGGARCSMTGSCRRSVLAAAILPPSLHCNGRHLDGSPQCPHTPRVSPPALRKALLRERASSMFLYLHPGPSPEPVPVALRTTPHALCTPHQQIPALVSTLRLPNDACVVSWPALRAVYCGPSATHSPIRRPVLGRGGCIPQGSF